MLRLGDTAPDFNAETTQGPIQFHEFLGNDWGLFFSHPEDFTPVCTTELACVAKMSPEWEKRNIKVIALSCNGLEDHDMWIKDINTLSNSEFKYPIIADEQRKVARQYGMLDQVAHDSTNVDQRGTPYTVRSVFIIDPKKKIRLILTYPASCGRNFDEILRTIDSLKTSDLNQVCTPANWVPGQKVIVPPFVATEDALQKFKRVKTKFDYLRFVKIE